MNSKMNNKIITIITYILFLSSLVFILVIIGIPRSHSHSWYDYECCHDQDCAPVIHIGKHEEGDLFTTKHGTVLSRNNDPMVKIKPSKDDNIHVCMRMRGGMMYPICIYYPALY